MCLGFHPAAFYQKCFTLTFQLSGKKEKREKEGGGKRGKRKALRNVLCLLGFEGFCLQRATRGYTSICKRCGTQQRAQCSTAASAGAGHMQARAGAQTAASPEIHPKREEFFENITCFKGWECPFSELWMGMNPVHVNEKTPPWALTVRRCPFEREVWAWGILKEKGSRLCPSAHAASHQADWLKEAMQPNLNKAQVSIYAPEHRDSNAST